MAQRITSTMLTALTDLLNRRMTTPQTPYRADGEGGSKAQVGNYHISHAYGGASLHQISNEGGGCRDVLSCGHIPMRDLYNQIHAFLRGIDEARK